MHFNSSLSSISMNKRCLYAPLVTSVLFYWLSMFKTKRWQPDLPTDMCKAICTLTKTVGLWEWTLLIWKTIQVCLGQFTWLSLLGEILCLYALWPSFRRIWWELCDLEGGQIWPLSTGVHIMSHFSNGHIIKGILHSMLICTAVPLHVPYIMSYDSIKPLSTYVSRHYKYSVCILTCKPSRFLSWWRGGCSSIRDILSSTSWWWWSLPAWWRVSTTAWGGWSTPRTGSTPYWRPSSVTNVSVSSAWRWTSRWVSPWGSWSVTTNNQQSYKYVIFQSDITIYYSNVPF